MSTVRALVTLLITLAVPQAAAAQGAGPQAYHGVPVPGTPPAVEVQSTPATYDGEALVVQGTYVGREAAEPTMGVDRLGRAFYAASAFDGVFGISAKTKVMRSVDGGVTWQDVNPKLPGTREDLPPASLDPMVYVDRDTGRVFTIDLEGLVGSFLSFSDDGGTTWTSSALTSPGINDHQTLFAGPPPAGNPALTPRDPKFPKVLYYCVNQVTNTGCSASADGGITFTPTAPVPWTCAGCQTGHGVSDSSGRVFLPRGEIGFEIQPLMEGEPRIAISENGGLTWRISVVARNQFTASRHTAVAADAEDNLYYVWFEAEQRLPYLSISRDHGATWSTPLMIAPPGVHDVNFPMITAGDEGRIAITFPGTRVDDQDDITRTWDSYVVVSTNALDEDPLFVSNIANASNDPIHRGECIGRCAGMYDFLDIDMSPLDGTVWATATDTCTGSCRTNPHAEAAAMQGVAIHQLAGPRLLTATAATSGR